MQLHFGCAKLYARSGDKGSAARLTTISLDYCEHILFGNLLLCYKPMASQASTAASRGRATGSTAKNAPGAATSIGRNGQEPLGQVTQPMHTAPRTCRDEPRLKSSTGHGIELPRCHLRRPTAGRATQYFRDTRKLKRGPHLGALKAPRLPSIWPSYTKDVYHRRHYCKQT